MTNLHITWSNNNYKVSHTSLTNEGAATSIVYHGIPKTEVKVLLGGQFHSPILSTFDKEFQRDAKEGEEWITLPIELPTDFEKGWQLIQQYLPELSKVGLKLLTYSQLVWLWEVQQTNKWDFLFGTESNIKLTWYKEARHIYLNIHKNGNFFLNSSQGSSNNLSFCKQGDFSTIVSMLETGYQLEAKWAVWASKWDDELGYEPNFDPDFEEDELDYLVPISLPRIQRLNQPLRRQILEEMYHPITRSHKFDCRFQIHEDDFNILWYEENGFKLDCILAAEKGDEQAKKALAALS